ncbi:Hypothetical protein, putative, partial [Bodo saltans]
QNFSTTANAYAHPATQNFSSSAMTANPFGQSATQNFSTTANAYAHPACVLKSSSRCCRLGKPVSRCVLKSCCRLGIRVGRCVLKSSSRCCRLGKPVPPNTFGTFGQPQNAFGNY